MVPRGRCAAAAAATVVAAAVAAVAGAQTVVKLNAGGGAVGAFAADAPALVTGASRANVLPAAVVTGTAGLPRALYTSRRYAGEGGTFAYAIPVERGTYYAVRLHFAEIWERVDAPGARLFSVALEGATVLCNYDVFADVGTNVATVKTFTTVVTDGVLDVEFTSVVGTAMVMAIEVEPVAGGGCAPPTSPPTPTPTPTPMATPHAAGHLCRGVVFCGGEGAREGWGAEGGAGVLVESTASTTRWLGG